MGDLDGKIGSINTGYNERTMGKGYTLYNHIMALSMTMSKDY